MNDIDGAFKGVKWWQWLLAIPLSMFLLPVGFIAKAFGNQAFGWYEQQINHGRLKRWWWTAAVYVASGVIWTVLIWVGFWIRIWTR